MRAVDDFLASLKGEAKPTWSDATIVERLHKLLRECGETKSRQPALDFFLKLNDTTIGGDPVAIANWKRATEIWDQSCCQATLDAAVSTQPEEPFC